MEYVDSINYANNVIETLKASYMCNDHTTFKKCFDILYRNLRKSMSDLQARTFISSILNH